MFLGFAYHKQNMALLKPARPGKPKHFRWRMNQNLEPIEATRARFCPKRITTLFVGESAPASGDFFFYGNNAMLGHMGPAVELALGESSDFLKSFKAYGWYLDDLVLEPVDKLSPLARRAKCLDAKNSLAGKPMSVLGERAEDIYSC